MVFAARPTFVVDVEPVPFLLALLLGACAAQTGDDAAGQGGAAASSSSASGGSSAARATGGSPSATPGASGVSSVAGAGSSAGTSAAAAGALNGGGGASSGAGSGGAANGGAGAASGGAGGAPVSIGSGTTPDLIGPGGPTCGNPNATHDDGWICLLSSPAAGSNVVGAWFDYAWPAPTSCMHHLKKPSGATRNICFSGGSCAAGGGAGIGFSVCDVHGVNVSTWPEMQQLIASHGLSSTGKSAFSACNTGAKITQVSWTASGAGTPAGMSVVFQDAADASLGRVDGLAAGATSLVVPANIDTAKAASVHFQFGGAVASWDFCLSKITISYQ
ncbi:MAG TPA: hypothetical protein VHB79_02285 [Polyangiaceae bacterium]|nr:hypothetical protein [Polyangiaceae bacterium]